jgi:hypothetical protein
LIKKEVTRELRQSGICSNALYTDKMPDFLSPGMPLQPGERQGTIVASFLPYTKEEKR